MKIITKNKEAFFNYVILEKYIAGIELRGSEVKSIKANKVNISEAYCLIKNLEIYLINMHVSEHDTGGKHNNHLPLRERKLLLNKKEIKFLETKVKQKGLTLIILSILLNEKGLIKIEIGLGRGKHTYDKSKDLKLKDLERDLKNNLLH